MVKQLIEAHRHAGQASEHYNKAAHTLFRALDSIGCQRPDKCPGWKQVSTYHKPHCKVCRAIHSARNEIEQVGPHLIAQREIMGQLKDSVKLLKAQDALARVWDSATG